MNQNFKRLSVCVITLILCFHFALVAVYCFPQTKSSSKISLISRLYIYPIFQQNWGLFVPAPNVERKLFVRYKTNAGFTDWEDILSTEIVNHKQNRLSGNEARVLLISNSLIYALNSLDGEPSSIYLSKINNPSFNVLRFEVEQYLKLRYQSDFHTDYELLLVSSGVKKGNAYYIQELSLK